MSEDWPNIIRALHSIRSWCAEVEKQAELLHAFEAWEDVSRPSKESELKRIVFELLNHTDPVIKNIVFNERRNVLASACLCLQACFRKPYNRCFHPYKPLSRNETEHTDDLMVPVPHLKYDGDELCFHAEYKQMIDAFKELLISISSHCALLLHSVSRLYSISLLDTAEDSRKTHRNHIRLVDSGSQAVSEFLAHFSQSTYNEQDHSAYQLLIPNDVRLENHFTLQVHDIHDSLQRYLACFALFYTPLRIDKVDFDLITSENHSCHSIVSCYGSIMQAVESIVLLKPSNLDAWTQHLEVIHSLLSYIGVLTSVYNFSSMNSFNERIETPLHVACRKKDIILLTLLLDSGADINSTNRNSETPLHIACNEKLPIFVQSLLDHGADLNPVNWRLETPLHRACTEIDIEIVRMLLASGAAVDSQTSEGFTPLHSLCARISWYSNPFQVQNDACLIAGLLVHHNCPANARDNKGRTGLCVLLDSNTLPKNAISQEYASRNIAGIVDIFCYLLSVSNVSISDNLGRSVLHYCVKKNFTEGLNAAIAKDKSLINKKDSFGLTPLHALLYTSPHKINVKIFQILLQSGVHLNSPSNLKVTALHLAVVANANDVIEVLLKNGVNVNATDAFESSILHYAVYARSDPLLVQLLLGRGAIINMQDCLGRNVLDYAEEIGSHELLPVLKSTSHVPPSSDMRSTEDKTVRHDYPSTRYRYLPESFYLENQDAHAVYLKPSVTRLINSLVRKVGQFDPRLTCRIALSGSVNEGTKCGAFDEFDYMCFLTGFDELFKAECDEYGEATVTLREAFTGSATCYSEFFDADQKLVPERVKHAFVTAVDRLVCDKETWSKTNFVFLPSDLFNAGPSTCLQLHWHGPHNKALDVSIDIVLTLRISKWKENPICSIPRSTYKFIQTFGLDLVMPGDQCFRVSMSLAEANVMKSVPSRLKHGYIEAKKMRSILVDSNCSYREKERSHEASKLIETYTLKTAFLHVLRERGFLTLGRHVQMDVYPNLIRLHHAEYWCREIYRYIVSNFDKYGCISSFFFPKKKISAYELDCKKILVALES